MRGSLANGARETLIIGTALRSAVAAAVVGATMTRWVLQNPTNQGVVILGDERLPTDELLAAVQAAGVRLYEFTGVARPLQE